MQGWFLGPLMLAEHSQDESKWDIISSLVVFIGLTIWANVRGYRHHHERACVREHGVWTQARIRSKGIIYRGQGATSSLLGYEYDAPDPAMPQQSKRYVSFMGARYFPAMMRKGDTFRVRYLPDNPKVHEGHIFITRAGWSAGLSWSI